MSERGWGRQAGGNREGGPNLGTSKKKTRRAQIPSLYSDRPHVAGESTGIEVFIVLLLDMSNQMHAMEDHVSQCKQADPCKQAQKNEVHGKYFQPQAGYVQCGK